MRQGEGERERRKDRSRSRARDSDDSWYQDNLTTVETNAAVSIAVMRDLAVA